MRRNLLCAALALVLVPLTVATVLRLMAEPPPSKLPFPKPNHRVAVAVEAVMQAEMATVTRFGNTRITQDFRHAILPAGVAVIANTTAISAVTLPPIDEFKIPEGDPAFWGHFAGANVPSLLTLDHIEWAATTRDGRTVQVTIESDPVGDGSVVDFHGDAAVAAAFSGKIADRLAHPAHVHDSPEDRAALMAFFKPTAATVGGFLPPLANGPPAKLDPKVAPAASPGVDPEEEPR